MLPHVQPLKSSPPVGDLLLWRLPSDDDADADDAMMHTWKGHTGAVQSLQGTGDGVRTFRNVRGVCVKYV